MTTSGRRADLYLSGSAADRVNCDVVRFGDFLFVSGCAPTDETTAVVGLDDIVVQARQTLLNLQRMLALAGATLSDVLRTTVYVTDIDDYPLIRPVRMDAFGSVRPASTLVEVSRLARPGMRIEIDAIAGLSPL